MALRLPPGFCPFSMFLFIASSTYATFYLRSAARKKTKETDGDKASTEKTASTTTTTLPPCKVVFVLGGPGTGKGTQCSLVVERMAEACWVHLSAGDLLRAERSKKDSELADVINSNINAGRIVPASITVRLLENAMIEAYKQNNKARFLIDGFPRSQGNVDAWSERMPHHDVLFCVNFAAPEEILVGRLLERKRGDDTIETIRKRFATHQTQVEPILALYEARGRVKTIQSDKPIEDVYRDVEKILKDI